MLIQFIFWSTLKLDRCETELITCFCYFRFLSLQCTKCMHILSAVFFCLFCKLNFVVFVIVVVVFKFMSPNNYTHTSVAFFRLSNTFHLVHYRRTNTKIYIFKCYNVNSGLRGELSHRICIFSIHFLRAQRFKKKSFSCLFTTYPLLFVCYI